MNLKTRFSAALICCAFSPLIFATSLDIPANSNFVVDKKVASTDYTSLTIGDDAQIKIADDVRFWSLNLKSLKVGNNVVINADGATGASGENGADGENAESGCNPGKGGGDGSEGLAGQQGKSFLLRAQQVELGSLTISAIGGKGGNGGNGGNGGDGLAGKSCKGGDGGNGGNGGNAGSGGRGGQVELYLPEDLLGESNKIKVLVTGGSAGQIGAGGKSGKPAEGHYLNRGTATGIKKWISAGDEGKRGTDGEAGLDGGKGVFATYVQDGSYQRSVTTIEKPAPTNSAEQQSLLQRIEALESRVKALESAK